MDRLFLFACFLVCFGHGCCYLPILVFPGLNDATPAWDIICAAIIKQRPGTECVKIQPYTFLASNLPIWEVVEMNRKAVQPFFEKYPDGVNFLCHSQGGLIGRALIETTDNHPVHNYVSLAGPQLGVFGIPETNISLLGKLNPASLTAPALSNLFYSKSGQDVYAAAGYWHDPNREADFLKYSSFLPLLNNQKPHGNFSAYKQNFLRLKKAKFFASGSDSAVIPKESTWFEYPDENKNIIPMNKSNIYVNDTFGLRTMIERGDATIEIIPGFDHNNYLIDMTCIDKYYLPNLS